MQFQAPARDNYDAEDQVGPIVGGTGALPIIFNSKGILDANEQGWKGTIRINPNEMITLAMKFDGFTGRYMYHCPILEHEDHDMMRPFLVQPAAIIKMMEHYAHSGGHHH